MRMIDHYRLEQLSVVMAQKGYDGEGNKSRNEHTMLRKHWEISLNMLQRLWSKGSILPRLSSWRPLNSKMRNQSVTWTSFLETCVLKGEERHDWIDGGMKGRGVRAGRKPGKKERRERGEGNRRGKMICHLGFDSVAQEKEITL